MKNTLFYTFLYQVVPSTVIDNLIMYDILRDYLIIQIHRQNVLRDEIISRLKEEKFNSRKWIGKMIIGSS